MEKYWIIDEKQNRLIFIKNKSIFFGTPKGINNSDFLVKIKKGIIEEDIFNIPYSYIRNIESQSKLSKIKIYYGNNSEDEIFIKDNMVKNEIFEYLRSDLTKFEYIEKTPSLLKHAKPQIFGILFSVIAFLWTLYIAIQIENGIVYEVVGRPGISGIILILAQFGMLKVIIGFSILLLIAIYSFSKKSKNRSLTKYLIRN